MRIVDRASEYLSKHPLLNFVVLVIAEDIVLNIFLSVVSLLNKKFILYLIWADKSIESFDDYVSANPHAFIDFNVNVRLAGMVIFAMLTLIWMYVTRIRADARNKYEALEKKNEELSCQLDRMADTKQLLDEYLPIKEMREVVSYLSEYTQKSDVVDSIQLYTHPQLPATSHTGKSTIEIPFEFIDGTATKDVNINVLYRINYKLDYEVYHQLLELFKDRNSYYSEHKLSSNLTKEHNIRTQAIDLFKTISNTLNNIDSISKISDEHYAYYRILEILATLVIAKEELVECKKLLKYTGDIENQLKKGQRTGLLGAAFIESMYCFGNENSIVKKNRGYFATPFEFKGHKMIMLVVLQRDKLRLAPDDREIEFCKAIYDEIGSLLAEKYSERSQHV